MFLQEIDLDANGLQRGFVRIPHSVHRSAYGVLPIPIASIAHGAGPTILVMAGNHGDEYEGQVIISELIRTVAEDDVAGQLILLPMANLPAALAGTRTSPEDGGNLNRSFPGNRKGGPTERIAYFIEQEIIARADVVFDLHSGGSSMIYQPTLMVSPATSESTADLTERVIGAFAAVNALVRERKVDDGYLASAALRQGAVGFTAELGGAGAVDPDIRTEAGKGLIRALSEVGLWRGLRPPQTARRPRRLSNEALLFAPEIGIFEPLVAPGHAVRAGQSVALIHQPEVPATEPLSILSEVSAVVLAKRSMGRVVRGDCLFHLAQEGQRDEGER